MSHKKILIVSRSFYPMNSPRSFRTTELVKEFARNGHDVTLLTLNNDPVHEQFEQEYGVRIRDFGPLSFPSIDYKKGNKFIRLLKRLARRGLNLLFEYPDIELMFRVSNALRKESGYDLLISIAVPHPVHWGVARAWREQAPIADTWVADCGDPYMGFRLDRFNKPFWFRYLEKSFCRKADYISVPIEEAKEAYYEEFRHKIRVIPQGFNFDDIKVDRSGFISNGIPVFGYAGNLLGGGRNPHELLEYLVNQERPFKFVIYTDKDGPATPYLKRANGRIDIRDTIPRPQLLEELGKMDFLVNLENVSQTQLPSKLIDYYLAGRPVLSVPNQNLDTEIVDRFLDGNYAGRYFYENMDRYRIENVCRQFLELCETAEK